MASAPLQGLPARAAAIAEAGGLSQALACGALSAEQSLSMVELLVMGLLAQGVRKYVGVFGHGSTALGDVLCDYQRAGLVKVYNVRHEVEASHIAATLRWQYGERVAVFTSIGPGALHALAGSLLPLSNQIGVYYLLGDETTEDEGYNMQQIPRPEQQLFLKLFSQMGASYSVHTAQALPAALRRGHLCTADPAGELPFYLLLPMNVQAQTVPNFNLRLLPVAESLPRSCPEAAACERALSLLRGGGKWAVKIGNGARGVPADLLAEFLQLTGAVLMHGPGASGVLSASHPRNMGVSGSKGSLCGNYVMEHCRGLVVIGARAVCQWDCSATGWSSVERIINVNTRLDDAAHYNRSCVLTGDATLVLTQLVERLRRQPVLTDEYWLAECVKRKRDWRDYLAEKLETPAFFDTKWRRPLLSQPTALSTAIEFCQQHRLVKYFDAGDVQANGFQLTADEEPGLTYTDTGSSFMGYAVSALVAGGMADAPRYGVAFSGDGSFFINPQVLIDAVRYGVRGMILLFDNRRMSAISSLQRAQYGRDFATDDEVEIDYLALVEAVKGVKAFFGGYEVATLRQSLEEAHRYQGLSVVHVPVYFGEDERSEIGAFGRWNVGNWCEQVQQLRNKLALA